MLEQRGLLLGRWQADGPGPETGRARTRPVHDLATGQPLGFVRAQASLAWPILRWLARPGLNVYETEDASLLCRVSRLRGLPWCWEVRDADERRVAVVYRRLILDSVGRRLALVQWPTEGGPGRFVSAYGAELGLFQTTAEGVSLTFGPALEQAPFAKMALLSAVLTYESALRKRA